ncbi:hypothetical protein D1814_04960 [Alteromonas sp. BL110]|uniref:hypothetical protein n=1 Tax=Alteromonas sp. BL110 TaxID=1714845 RepID=UPI000E492356|nr:hypothetical protein [Alteromonas sp. BL110]AXT38067.1 hypothetical protein D1814_04960 [Alteromonas sp. BL110]RKM80809.1 hypothetical protein D7031_18305 [Alteromonas sp. BL110]
MNDGIFGIAALATIATICSIVTHLLIKKFVIAVFVSGLLSALFFQFAAYFNLGQLDPFYLFAAFASFLISCAISTIIGSVMLKRVNS